MQKNLCIIFFFRIDGDDYNFITPKNVALFWSELLICFFCPSAGLQKKHITILMRVWWKDLALCLEEPIEFCLSNLVNNHSHVCCMNKNLLQKRDRDSDVT